MAFAQRARQVLGERQILARVPATRLGVHESQRTEHAPARGERHDHRRAKAELAQQPQMLGVDAAGDEELVGDLGI